MDLFTAMAWTNFILQLAMDDYWDMNVTIDGKLRQHTTVWQILEKYIQNDDNVYVNKPIKKATINYVNANGKNGQMNWLNSENDFNNYIRNLLIHY
jgi:hypothetical protein